MNDRRFSLRKKGRRSILGRNLTESGDKFVILPTLLISQRERVVIDVVKTAQAAHISLTPEEVVKFERQLSLVLDYVECLRQVAVDGVEPLPHPVAQMGSLRADKVESGLSESMFQAAVPATIGGEVCVPRVIEA